MGIRDWFKNLKNKLMQKKLLEGQKDNNYGSNNTPYFNNVFSCQDQRTNETIMIKDIKENNSFRYGNNQLNTIYTAVISKSKQNEGFNFDKEICFEVPNNISIETLKESGMLEYLLNNPMAHNLSYDKSNYIGRIDINYNTNQYSVNPPALFVQKYVEQNLTTALQTKHQMQKQMQEERHKQNEEELINYENTQYMQHRVSQIAEAQTYKDRINNPKFKTVNQNLFECYDSFSGNIIKLGNVKHMQSLQYSTGQKSYIYQGAVSYKSNYEDAELLGLGQNVCFELPIPIEQMSELANKNPEYGRIMGNLLSLRNLDYMKHSQGYNPLTYVGSILANNQGKMQIYNSQNKYITNLINQSKIQNTYRNSNINRQDDERYF